MFLFAALVTTVVWRIMRGSEVLGVLTIMFYSAGVVWNVCVGVRDSDVWSLVLAAGALGVVYLLWRLTQTSWFQDRSEGRVRPIERRQLAALLALVFCCSLVQAFLRTFG